MAGSREIWLGDLVRSLVLLAPDDDPAREAIARALGLELPAIEADEASDTLGSGVDGSPAKMSAVAPDGSAAAEASEPLAPTPTQVTPRMLEPSATGQVRGERPGGNGPELPEASASMPAQRSPYRPLFSPRLQRQILIAMAAEARFDGSIDVRAIVRLVGDGQPIVSLPRLRRTRLGQQVQLLLDVGSGMEPWTRDRSAIVARFIEVLGSTIVSTVRFRDLPLSAAGSGPIWTWKRYRPPPPPATVIAITDLGIGADPLASPPAERHGEWLELGRMLRARSTSLLVLNPYEPDRWPAPLSDAFSIVRWDRPTGVADVLRATASNSW